MLTIDATDRDGWTILELSGRIDAMTSPQLFARIEAALQPRPARFALDLAAVDYISSAGLRIVLRTLKAVGRWQGEMCLVGPHGEALQVLRAAGLTQLLDVRQSLDGDVG